MDYLRDRLGWESAYTYNAETFGPQGTLARASERDVLLVRDLRAALARLNPDLPEPAREQGLWRNRRLPTHESSGLKPDRPRSLRPHPGILHHLRPLRGLRLDKPRERLGRSADNFEALR